jgi:hypothetical protein
MREWCALFGGVLVSGGGGAESVSLAESLCNIYLG